MTLAATVAEPLAPKQAAYRAWSRNAEPDVSGLIDLLANRVGEQNLYRIAPVASDVPERAVRHIPALAPETGAEWPGHWPRPSRLFARPEPIETVALLPDHPPVSFTWRGVRRRVKRADGPERVFGEWWKRDPELDRGARLLPHRGRCRRALLGVPRWRRRGSADRLAALVPAWDLRMSGPRYAELQVTSHFSFLRGASSCEELFAAAAAAWASRRWPSSIATRSPASSAPTRPPRPRACAWWSAAGSISATATSVLVYPTDRPAYSRLCRLLSLGKKRAGKAKCDLAWADLVAYGDGLIAVLVPDSRRRGLRAAPAPAARGLRRPRLYGALAAPAAERSAPPASSFPISRPQMRVRDRRHQRRAVPRAWPAHPAGCRHLHPPRRHHRRARRPPRTPCRSLSESRPTRCTACSPLSRGAGPHASRSSSAAASRSTSWPISIPRSGADPALTPQQTLEKLTWEGAAWRYPEGCRDVVQPRCDMSCG